MRLFFALLTGMVLVIACAREREQVKASDLFGRWELREGFKDGEKSQLLNKLYFEIDSATFRTNLMLDEQAYPYELEGATLLASGPNPLNFEIEQVEDTSLILNTTIRKHEFSFILGRASRTEAD